MQKISNFRSQIAEQIASLSAGRQGFLVLLAMTLTGVPAFADSLTIDEAVSRALRNNPSIQAASEETKAAKARIPQAYTPENPEIGVQFDRTPIDTLNVEDAMSINYKIKQIIPFPGKLISSGKSAKNEWRAAKELQKQSALNVTSEVKKTFFNVLLVDKKIAIEKRNKQFFQKYAKVAETKYAVGQTPFDDPIKASVEASSFENILNELTQEKISLIAELSYLMGENISDDTVLEMPKETKFDKKIEDIKGAALKGQPALKAAADLKNASKNKETLAKQGYLPNIMAELEYNQIKDQQNAWTAEFGISIPLWFFGKQAPAVREAKAMHRASTRMYEDSYNRLNALIIGTYEKIRSAEKIAEIYKKTILPRSEANLRSAETSYITGKADFLNLVDAARKWGEYHIDYWQARTTYESAIAEMEALIGTQL